VKQTIFKLMCYLFFFFLAACQFKHIETLKNCEQACGQSYYQCQQSCQDSCPKCCGKSYSRSLKSYQRYVNEKNITGDPAINLLQSFDDHLKCNKNSCNCQADYILCKQVCKGQITKRLKTFKPC